MKKAFSIGPISLDKAASNVNNYPMDLIFFTFLIDAQGTHRG